MWRGLTEHRREHPVYVWYSKVPVGVNYLYDFMPRMSAEAGLSRRYTNHCIRAMVASTLSGAWVSNMGIMSVTGHRNVQSLNSYIKPSDSERRTISGILTGDQDSNLALTQVTRPQFAPQSRFLNYPTRPCDTESDFHSSQFNSQSNSRISSFSIFSGPVTGGHVTVHVYKH